MEGRSSLEEQSLGKFGLSWVCHRILSVVLGKNLAGFIFNRIVFNEPPERHDNFHSTVSSDRHQNCCSNEEYS